MLEGIIWNILTPAAVSAIVSYLAKLYADRLNNNWKENTDTKLENLKSKLNENSNIVLSLVEGQKSSYSLAHEKRIIALEETWANLCELNSKIPKSIVFLYNGLSKNEIEELFESMSDIPERRDFFKDYKEMDQSDFLKSYSALQTTLANKRLFLGEDLYYSANIYNALISRIMLHTEKGFKNKKFTHWHNDSVLINLLKGFLSKEEMEDLLSKECLSFSYVIGLLEGKILNKMNDVLSGNIATTVSIEQISKIKKYMDLNN